VVPWQPEPFLAPRHGQISYSQAGEDMVVNFFFEHFKIRDITYLDVGAYEPIFINNTYFFYNRGYRGVLIEPNIDMAEKLRGVRPRDTTLVAGVGVDKARDANYYVMSEPSWSTFDKAEAEHQVKVTRGRIFIKEVRKMPLLNVNDVMAEHFNGRAPTFVSIDAEGWHFEILKSIDFERFRPPVICVETLVSGESRTIPEIPAFMKTKGYADRGGSFVNTVFVDSKVF
jgi:FkbM family methyltransferase